MTSHRLLTSNCGDGRRADQCLPCCMYVAFFCEPQTLMSQPFYDMSTSYYILKVKLLPTTAITFEPEPTVLLMHDLSSQLNSF
jgi:hypothetical protein